jgi:GR25 family glycosyltransferase involved in LPS biosynthesis
MNSISDIKNAFYINLLSRPDRRLHVEAQLETIGIKAERFNAIKLKNGAVGCSMSHLKCLEIAKKRNWDHVLIIEDDILFLNPPLFVNQLNTFLSNHKNFDVLLFAGNNMPPYSTIDNTCVKVTKCQTTTCYLVKSHYYNILINNYKEGIKKLISDQTKPALYAIDKYWFRLQEKDKWYLIIPLTVTQREDYSDIEKRKTNYTNVMTDLDKKAFIKAQENRLKLMNSFKLF